MKVFIENGKFSDLKKEISGHQFDLKNDWLLSAIILDPDTSLNEKSRSFFEFISKKDNLTNLSPRPLEFYSALLQNDPKFLVKLAEQVKELYSQDCRTICNIFSRFQWHEPSKLFEAFDSEIQPFSDWYIMLRGCQSNFDNSGRILAYICEKNPNFIREYLLCFAKDDVFTLNSLKKLWDDENYEEIMDRILDFMVSKKRIVLIHSLFDDRIIKQDKCVRWIERVIKKRSEQPSVMTIVSEIVAMTDDTSRTRLINVFIENNQDIQAFKRLIGAQKLLSGSGSLVPACDREIAFFRKLKESLPGEKHIEHRNCVEDIIKQLNEEKEWLLACEFKERW